MSETGTTTTTPTTTAITTTTTTTITTTASNASEWSPQAVGIAAGVAFTVGFVGRLVVVTRKQSRQLKEQMRTAHEQVAQTRLRPAQAYQTAARTPSSRTSHVPLRDMLSLSSHPTSPSAFAAKALIFGTVLCGTVAGISVFAVAKSMGVSSMEEFAHRMRVIVPEYSASISSSIRGLGLASTRNQPSDDANAAKPAASHEATPTTTAKVALPPSSIPQEDETFEQRMRRIFGRRAAEPASSPSSPSSAS
ncbi:hypothetical protein CAOG_04820 [Capsaspora owczarzaki ATCC 30864]|uniref:Transmembrane protein 242 n=1 Tax=Capsaspora owczarzaki (strain ATCC 30864) TaxID=595528 RepID=A0A0D2WQW0_CAPO3|nr:hypothetical protein CAOG_04820 [Capsaspora owczarzaki ATCC 30864]KJE94135.1 hypothetical protein CAOG_004820 [Capsaspora owczarzaki ATCC 30864]|eukprot:XP_004347571.1 hypothetical protein CAOG_04820 [Capsaspora owczarzaki ATCC 30864]